MQLKPINAIAVLLLVVASLLVSGCTTSTTSTSSPSPTPLPDYTYTLARSLSTTMTPVSKITKVNASVYSGSYQFTSDKNTTKSIYDIKIEIAKSQTDASERYGALVLQKQDAGYVTTSNPISGSTIFGDVKASWAGSVNRLTSATLFEVLYAYDDDISQWVVVTISTNITA